MHCTVDELRQRMTVREYRKWLSVFSVAPWGEERDAQNFDTLANISVGLVTPKSKFKPRRYTPDYSNRKLQPTEPQTPEQLKRAVVKTNALLGGEVKHGQVHC